MLRLPTAELVAGMGLRWIGNGADFVDDDGRLAAFDPTAYADGPSALLPREESIREFMQRERLTLGWAVLGEKRVHPSGFGFGANYPMLRISGTYVLGQERPGGFVKCMLDDPDVEDSETPLKVIDVIRSRA